MKTNPIITITAIIRTLTAAVIIIPSGCTRETSEECLEWKSGKSISFSAESPKRDMDTKSDCTSSALGMGTTSQGDSLYLQMTEEPWPLPLSPENQMPGTPDTKVSPYTSSSSLTSVSLGIMASSYSTSGAAVSGWTVYPTSTTAPIKASYTSSKWVPETNIYYPGSGYLRFFAYAPFTDTNDDGAEDDSHLSFTLANAAYPTMSYTVNSAYGSQKDILIATTEKTGNPTVDALGVALPFEHALAGVRFKGIGGLTVSSVVISGVYDGGTLTLNPDGYSWGSLSKSVTTPSFTISSPSTTTSGDYEVFNDVYTLMMIPQTLPSGATITVTLSDDTVVAADVSGHEWKRGKVTTYIVSLAHVSFDDASDLTLWKSESATRTATGSGFLSTPTITYSSSDESVATVNPSTGAITAVGPGQATITATASGGAPGTLTVYVNAVRDLTLSPSAEIWEAGGTATNITATVTLNDGSSQFGTPGSLTFSTSSSNESYVTVNNSSYTVSSFTSGSGSVEGIGVTGVGESAGVIVNVTATVSSSITVDGSDKTGTCEVGIKALSLSGVKSLINRGETYSGFLGWKVNSDGVAYSDDVVFSGTLIGYIGYMSTANVDTGVSGSRILVIASANASTYVRWGSLGISRGLTTDGMTGYSYTSKLMGYDNPASAHPAAYAAWNYSASIPSGGSTPAHWFMPTKAQLSAIISALGGYSTFKTKVGWPSNSYYWSSTEYNDTHAWYLFLDGNWYTSSDKSATCHVRSCFAY